MSHSLGVGHEQGRYDRDEHVVIHEENIDPTYLSQFRKIDFSKWVDMETPYDFKSVMHYGGNSFAEEDKNGNKKTSLSYKYGSKKGQPTEGMGGMGSFGMSSMDVYQMCKMYECERCMGQDIPTYDGKAWEHYMYKCGSGPSE